MTSYAAHIVTNEATALGDPEIIVMTPDEDADDGRADLIASYPLPDGATPEDVLEEGGWRVGRDTTHVETGYIIVDLEVADWEKIIEHVTFAKAQADTQATQQDGAWRTMIREAMLNGGSATRLGQAAGISRERVYQIRDGRR